MCRSTPMLHRGLFGTEYEIRAVESGAHAVPVAAQQRPHAWIGQPGQGEPPPFEGVLARLGPTGAVPRFVSGVRNVQLIE